MTCARLSRETHVVEILLDRFEGESSVLHHFGLVTGALEELERDLLVDDICGRALGNLDPLRKKQGTKGCTHCLRPAGP